MFTQIHEINGITNFDIIRGSNSSTRHQFVQNIRNLLCDKLVYSFYHHGIIEKKSSLSLNFIVDQVAVQLLQAANFGTEYFASSICGDGNCLFRAISKAMYGNEDLHLEIRFRTLLQMIVKRDELFRLSEILTTQTDWFLETSG